MLLLQVCFPVIHEWRSQGVYNNFVISWTTDLSTSESDFFFFFLQAFNPQISNQKKKVCRFVAAVEKLGQGL